MVWQVALKRGFNSTSIIKTLQNQCRNFHVTKIVQNVAYLFDQKSFQDVDKEWQEFKDPGYQRTTGSSGKAYMKDGESFTRMNSF